MANLDQVLVKGRVTKLLGTNQPNNISACLYQVVFAVTDPGSGEGGILLNPQLGAQHSLPLFVPFTGRETLAGTMLTIPGIGGVLRLDPDESAQFNWPNATAEIFNTEDGQIYTLGDVLAPENYAPLAGVAPVAPVPVQPVQPVAPVAPVRPPLPVYAGFDYDAWAAAFNEKSQRTFKITGGADDSLPNQPDAYTRANGFDRYAGVCFETVRANNTGVLGKAEDGPCSGDLVFFPFTPDFSPLLDPPGSYTFTTRTTTKSRVYTPAQYSTSTYYDYDYFWADPYWGGFGGYPIVIY
ncbi:MAG TPA: hypothetical protein V6C81_11795 [Planktothrix sp.]|jgi:hypothetical protein